MSEKRLHYDAVLKRKIILYAEEHGNRNAGRKFEVNEANIRRWRNNRASIFACKGTTKCFRGPKQGRYPQVDDEVLHYVLNERAKGLPVTIQMIQQKARECCKSLGIDENKFNAKKGWYERFMRRVGLSLKRQTSICQRLPADFEQKLMQFQQHLVNLRENTNYDFKHIGNADETQVFFDIPRNCTVNVEGAHDVTITTTGYEKQRISVMLSITADGQKLPPFLILNRKTIPKKEVFPEDVIVRAHKNGWMTSKLMDEWLQIVWSKRPGAADNPPSILVLNAFREHLTDEIKNKLIKMNSELVVIPDGMTSQLQPLDVSINKPFKEYFRKEYESWLRDDNLPLTTSGSVKRASASKIAKWVSAAWKKIPEKVVIYSFKKCCISNSLDGADEIVWEEAEIVSDSMNDSESENEIK